jgi:hypothetical protein
MRRGICVAVLAALALPTIAYGHGGGGGGGGGHGGGGGGGHGGFGGGGFHGGGGHMYSGGSHMYSGGTMRSGNVIGNGNAIGSRTTTQSTFLHNNFSSTNHGALQHSVNRMNTGNLNALHNGNANSFIKNNGINSTNPNHWTHNGNWNNFNHHGNWNNFNHNNNFFFFYPWFGFGAFGLWGWPYYGYGYGYGYGYPCYGYNYYGNGGYGYGANYAVAAQADPTTGAFADQGEADFKAGKYQAAARDWQHALIDDPKNGGIIMMLAQALFATGQYDEAAGATQAAMQALPEDKWGVVVTNYSQLYGNVQDYTDQLRALEKARDAKPDNPAIRFLLGFHFGYLGYPKQAVRELDKAMTLAPKDLGSRKIREIFAAKMPDAPPPPALPPDDGNGQPGDAKPALPPGGDGTKGDAGTPS